MNVAVTLVTFLLAAACGAPLLLSDARGTALRKRMDSEGRLVEAVVKQVQAAGGKRLLTVSLPDGAPLAIRVTSDEKFRKGESVRLRLVGGKLDTVGELEHDPLKPMGRAVALTSMGGILLLGLTLAMIF
jgi:hypothetical protein